MTTLDAPNPQRTDFFVGLDLGQIRDYTALAVVQRTTQADGKHAHAVRQLHRWPLGELYPKIVRDVAALLSVPPLRGCHFLVDQTGVGAAVVDLFREAAMPVTLYPVTFTGSNTWTRPADSIHLGKVLMVGVLQASLQSRRFQVADLPLRDVLMRELQSFKVKVTAAGNETFESWREKDHDDLVFAVGMACWGADNIPEPPTGPLFLYPEPPPEPGTPEYAERQRQWDKDHGIATINGHRIVVEEPEEDWTGWGRRR